MNLAKKLAPILIILVLVALIVMVLLGRAKEQQMLTVYLDNHAQLPVPLRVGHFQDTQCGMPIASEKDSAQVSLENGKTWFFDDIGCLALWLEGKSFKSFAKVWVYTRDTKEWVDGRDAWYSLTDTTPMGYGYSAYAHQNGKRIGFDNVLAMMGRGEHLNNPHIRKERLGNH